MCRRTGGVIAALLMTVLPACTSWEETKEAYVDDVNQLLHRRYAQVHAVGHLGALEEIYSPELYSDPKFQARKRQVLGSFHEITNAYSIIEELEPRQAGRPIRSQVAVMLDGEGLDRRPLSRVETLIVEVDKSETGWRVTQEESVHSQFTNAGSVQFREESVLRGVRNFAHMDGVPDRHGRPQPYPAGTGVAVGDIDGDDWLDIYFANGTGGRFLRNRGDGTFEDVTEKTGTGAPPPGRTRTALLADFSGDGRVDIFVARLDGPNLLYRQNADGTFTDIAADVGLTPTLQSTSACAADFNGDGHLDLYVLNGFNLTRRRPKPMHNALNGFPNALFVAVGDGTFREQAAAAGVDHTGFALACAASDYDGDGDMDLFVGNDFGFDVLYRNRGDGTFEDVTDVAGLGVRRASMSAAWGDVTGDGLPELFVSAMTSNSRWMVDQPGYPVPAPWPMSTLFKGPILDTVKEMLSGNRFYKNNGDGTFTAFESQTQNTGWGWSASFLDYDNDGGLDLYATNGFISGEDREDL